jgi:hypothetical protein
MTSFTRYRVVGTGLIRFGLATRAINDRDKFHEKAQIRAAVVPNASA